MSSQIVEPDNEDLIDKENFQIMCTHREFWELENCEQPYMRFDYVNDLGTTSIVMRRFNLGPTPPICHLRYSK